MDFDASFLEFFKKNLFFFLLKIFFSSFTEHEINKEKDTFKCIR